LNFPFRVPKDIFNLLYEIKKNNKSLHNMKTIYIKIASVVAVCFAMTTAYAQKENVGIGTTKPDQSALLDLSSQSKGLLIPRMSLEQRGSIQNPANGLMVYQTDFLSGFYYFDGKNWSPLTSTTNANSVADANNWGLLGNAGTDAATNFIGTTDAQDLVFKVGGQKSGLITVSNGSTFFGYISGLSNSGGDNTGVGTQALRSNTTGFGNSGIGRFALLSNTIGEYNMGIGRAALYSNISGSNNAGIGAGALFSNQSGSDNLAIGASAMYLNLSGSSNVAIGASSLFQVTGNYNIGIGRSAGSNKNGSGNIYIGYTSGSAAVLTSESDKLYIANSNTVTPLIYGDFGSAKYLAIGEVAVADRAAATSGGYRLLVKGGMITEKIKVATAGTADWADYVFDTDYKVMPLEKVEAFIKENKHLPNVPSTQEVMANGNDLGKTDAKLLEKIEELTLYMIEMNKEIKALKKENEQLKKKK